MLRKKISLKITTKKRSSLRYPEFQQLLTLEIAAVIMKNGNAFFGSTRFKETNGNDGL